MKKTILSIILALGLVAPSFASDALRRVGFTVQHDKDTKIVGTDVPCTTNLDPFFVLNLALQGVPVSDFKQATVTYKGKDYGACWLSTENKAQVFVADENGAAGFVDLGIKL